MKSEKKVNEREMKRARINTLLKISESVMLVIVPLVLFLCTKFEVSSATLLTLFAAVTSFVPFFIRFERQRPTPAEIMPVAVLSAVAIVGRIALNPIPNFQPVSALVILTGIFFGRQSGYLMGAFTALISNMILGQGLWTPWQMYAWGLMGFVAGLLAEKGVLGLNRKWLVYVYGVLASLLYGLLLDTWFLAAFVSDVNVGSATAAYSAGLVFGVSHISATVLFLALTLVPFGKKIARIKIKYGVGS